MDAITRAAIELDASLREDIRKYTYLMAACLLLAVAAYAWLRLGPVPGPIGLMALQLLPAAMLLYVGFAFICRREARYMLAQLESRHG